MLTYTICILAVSISTSKCT